jgi:pyruvate dehydrogenase E1 component beta subunit
MNNYIPCHNKLVHQVRNILLFVFEAGGVFKATVGLYDKFGPDRVRDTPISEQAILGAAMGAAMTGLKPVAEIMFSDFLAVCWDIVANQIAKSRYMTNGQVSTLWECCAPKRAPPPLAVRITSGIETWPLVI